MRQTPSETTGIKSLDKFLEHCHKRHYPAKSTIIYAEDRPDVLYFILDGSVTVLIEDTDGREIVLAYLNKGDFFGEMGLFDEQLKRSAWVRARNSCEVAEISYTKFRQVAQEHPDIVFAMASQMAARLRVTSRKVSDLAFMDVSGRVARTLLDLCKQPDAMTHPVRAGKTAFFVSKKFTFHDPALGPETLEKGRCMFNARAVTFY